MIEKYDIITLSYTVLSTYSLALQQVLRVYPTLCRAEAFNSPLFEPNKYKKKLDIIYATSMELDCLLKVSISVLGLNFV